MSLLLLGSDAPGTYKAVLLRNVERALTLLGRAYQVLFEHERVTEHPGHELYIMVGDEGLRRRPEFVRAIRAMGGKSVDMRSRYLPPQLPMLPRYLKASATLDPDAVFTHFPTFNPRGCYIGQGVNDDLLVPEHDDRFTVYVDNRHPLRRTRDKTQAILDRCGEIHARRPDIRFLYHTDKGIEENRFEACMDDEKTLPFAEIAAWYRKTHVFMPTHRESQGMVSAEIGMCGGLTMLERYMYPWGRRRTVPHRLYRGTFDLPEAVDIAANRAFTARSFGIEAFAARLDAAIDKAIGMRPIGRSGVTP